MAPAKFAMEKQKVVIVHDWLVGGGAERVVFELHKMFPEAPIYTSYATGEWRQKLDGKVVTGFLQRLPGLRKYLPVLRIWWFSHLDLSEYDLVISSSGAEAKGVKVKKPAVHINYCHAPTHYYWDRYEQYLQSPGFPTGFNWLARFGLKVLVAPLRKWDYKAAQRPDLMIANSSYTKQQIRQYYGRDSEVIHPPVDIERFTSLPSVLRKGFVIAGRQTPYKKVNLAVAACTQLGLPLTVIGSGPDHAKLVGMAGPTITFIDDADDQQLAERFAAAEAFIFPGVDDFGIVAVEAMAAGTPVIAYKAGGALDYVIEGNTGQFFSEQSVESLADCLKNFNTAAFDAENIKKSAQLFSKESFAASIREFISARI